MQTVALAHEVDFEGWRGTSRALALARTPPEDVLWTIEPPEDLFSATGDRPIPPGAGEGSFSVPRPLVELAQTTIQARDPERFALLYTLLWRVHLGERALLADASDPLVDRLRRLARSVARDTHKMHAFLRFRTVDQAGQARHVAWFEPDHYILEANADFFVGRFGATPFSILTPYRSLHWTGFPASGQPAATNGPEFGPGANASDIPDDAALERYWLTRCSALFNPARAGAANSPAPQKYWRNRPTAAAIPAAAVPASARDAGVHSRTMPEQQAMPATTVPPSPRAALSAPDLKDLARQAESCRRCPLWEPATQTVFGEGPPDARLMMIGEQPGDQEDLAGRPFVGPAGQLLDKAILEAGIDRRIVYVTNAVKHFKFEPRGKRRIHQKPEQAEIIACSVWLNEERRIIAPAVVLMLGATAARAVLGRTVTISRERGRPIALSEREQGLVTVHPSFLLRLPDPESKRREYAAFVADLKRARAMLGE